MAGAFPLDARLLVHFPYATIPAFGLVLLLGFSPPYFSVLSPLILGFLLPVPPVLPASSPPCTSILCHSCRSPGRVVRPCLRLRARLLSRDSVENKKSHLPEPGAGTSGSIPVAFLIHDDGTRGGAACAHSPMKGSVTHGFVSAPGRHARASSSGARTPASAAPSAEGDRDLRVAHVQRRRPAPPAAERRLQGAAPHDDAGRAARRARPPTSSPRAMKDWAIEHGATHYTHWFQPLTGITAEKHDSFIVADGRGPRRRGVQRQGTDPGRAGRVELPVGRHALHVRGARLHGVGSDEPAVAARRRRTARRSCIPTAFVSWTGESLDKKTPLLRSIEALSKQAVRILKLFGSKAERVDDDVRARAGVLPDRPQLLLRAARPDQRRPHALRRQAAQGPGARGSVLRRDPRARAGVHARRARPSSTRSACRSRRGTTKSRRASTRWRRSSRTPTSPPTTR